MVRRICPICDQIMKSAHYCRNCKSFVRNPYIRETDYYLNERHPASEEHCSFHDPWEEEKGQKPAKTAMPNVSANRQRSINPNVYGGAKDRSEQARQVAAISSKSMVCLGASPAFFVHLAPVILFPVMISESSIKKQRSVM